MNPTDVWVNPVHPEPSETLTTAYNRRLPEWRLQANTKANQEQWRNRRECVLAMFGVTMGFNNLIYLPSILMAAHLFNTFFLQYNIMMFLIGFPFLFLQLSIGQFTSFGPYRASKQVPLAEGVGLSLLISNAYTILRLNMVMSWLVYYFFSTFHFKSDPNLHWSTPWSECSGDESTINEHVECGIIKNDTDIIESNLHCYYTFFVTRLLKIPVECSMTNPKYDLNIDNFNWSLLGCIIFIWAIGYLYIRRGIRTIGKAVVWLVPITLILFTVMIIVGLSTNYDAASNGLKHHFQFSWESLYNLKSWYLALDHVFNTLNLGNGTMIVIGGYTRFQSPAHYDAFYVCVANVLFTFVAAILVFCFIGMSAARFGVHIDDAKFMGRNDNFAIFVLFPIVIDDFPFPPIWALLTFGTLFMMLTTEMQTNIMVFLKPFYEVCPWFTNENRKQLFKNLFVVSSFCLVALIWLYLSHNGALYFLYATKRELAIDGKWFILICFSGAFIYGFGMERLRLDIEFMLQFLPNKFFCYVWYALPFFLAVVLIFFVSVADEPVNAGDLKPTLIAARWAIYLVNILPIPIMAIWNVYWFHKNGKLKRILHPRQDQDEDSTSGQSEVAPQPAAPTQEESPPTTIVKRSLATSWLYPTPADQAGAPLRWSRSLDLPDL